MSDNMNISPKRPAAIYEPGELEHTRQNIGLLDPEEAQRMMKKLGGEIGIEKSMPFDEKSLPNKNRTVIRRTSPSSSGSGTSASGSAVSSTGTASSRTASSSLSTSSTITAAPKQDKGPQLPAISPKIRADMDEIMISYQIKDRLGFLANLINNVFNRGERVSADFVNGTLTLYVQRFTKLAVSVRRLLQDAPENFRQQVSLKTTTYHKAIDALSQFHHQELESLYQELMKSPQNVTIQQLIPFVRTFYADLYTVWFLTPKTVSEYLKRLYEDARVNNTSKTEAIQATSRESITCWRYVSEQMAKGLYPLLMRMCCLDLTPYPDILRTESAHILQFIGKTKYDLLFPDKEPPKPTPEEVAKKEEEEAEAVPAIPPMVQRGLQVLDTMFPKAGWLNIESMPDMYPYFQGVFQFQDGLNYIHPKNPMQIAIILMRIIEDFFIGCRYIPFRQDLALDFFAKNQTTQSLFEEFAEYREVLFDRNYANMMRDFVNNIYANSEYLYSQFGKKESSNLYWYAHNHFFPYLRFDLTFIDKPKPDTTLPLLKDQLPSISRFFSTIIARADKAYAADPAEARASEAIGAQKLWSPYHFPVPNAISRRLDVLLGGRKSRMANNLNMLKYCASIIAVLDWWVNDKNSPAYAQDATVLYRMDAAGKPSFNVDVVKNVNELFADSMKQKLAMQKPATPKAP